MAARFRFSAASAAALGVAADSPHDELAQRLGFPPGVKVTSVKPDGDGLALGLSGGGIEGEVTGEFTIGWRDGEPRIYFNGFRSVEPAEPKEG